MCSQQYGSAGLGMKEPLRERGLAATANLQACGSDVIRCSSEEGQGGGGRVGKASSGDVSVGVRCWTGPAGQGRTMIFADTAASAGW